MLLLSLLVLSSTSVPLEGWAHTTEGFRLRGDSNGALDQDLRFGIDGGASMGSLALDASAILFWDIDGKNPRFASVHDRKGALDLLVDTLELRSSGDLVTRASFGRLTVDQGWPITLDGAAFVLTPTPAWNVFLSGGRSVYFFGESDANEWNASIGTQLLVDQSLKFEIDYRALMSLPPTTDAAHSYGAALFGRVDESLLKLYARALDTELERVGARARLMHSFSNRALVGLDVDAAEQVITLGEIFEGGNPFFAVLGESKPHVRGSVDAYARMDLSDGWGQPRRQGNRVAAADDGRPGGPALQGGVHVGAAARKVFGDDSAFNRSAARVYSSIDAESAGFFASIILSYDFALVASQDEIVAVGGSAGYANDAFRFSLGTGFDRVRYTYYRDVNELTDVRSFFAAVDVRPLSWLRIKSDYTLELADRQIHTMQLLLVQDFGGAQ